MHGGAYPKAKAAAERRRRKAAQLDAARRYGPVETDPADALNAELARTNGIVKYLDEQVSRDPAALLDLDAYPAKRNAEPWQRMFMREREHLADLSKTILMTSMTKEQIAIRKKTVEFIEATILLTLQELGVDVRDRSVQTVIFDVTNRAHNGEAVVNPLLSGPKVQIEADPVETPDQAQW